MSPPVVLALASVACLLLALRPPPGRAADPVPPLLRVARRLPAPSALVAVIGGPERQADLDAAGLGESVAPGEVPRARCALAVPGAAAAVAGVAAPVLLPVALGLGVLGWLWPGLLVGRMAAARRRQIAGQLPDVLDLLGVCVEAGMALDPALRTVAQRLGGPLGAELLRALDDLGMGATRRAAYRALATRVGLPDLDLAVGALLSAEELGTPLSAVLRDQADAQRAATAQRARDRAARAAPKIQLVVATMMVPAVMVLVVTVMAIELARQVGPVLGGIR